MGHDDPFRARACQVSAKKSGGGGPTNPDKCGATTRAEWQGRPPGRPCGQPAGAGTLHGSGPCRLHGGTTAPQLKIAARKDQEKAATAELW